MSGIHCKGSSAHAPTYLHISITIKISVKSHNHVTWKYTQQKHDKPFNSIAVVILMTSAAQQAIWPIIRDTSGEITSTTLSSAEELVRLNFEVEH